MITLQNIADNANVSVRTVRRVIDKNTSVSEEKRKRVNASLKLLDYVPNILARGLKKNRSSILGIIADNLSLEIMTKKLAALQNECNIHGYRTMIAFSRGIDKEEKKVCQEFMQFCDGIIFLHKPGKKNLCYVKNSKIPFVLVDNYENIPNAVSINRRTGILEAIKKLHKNFKKILFLKSGEDSHYSFREVAFKEGSNLFFKGNSKAILLNHSNFSSGYNIVDKILKHKNSLCICYNDRIAAGLLKALYERDTQIPDDYGIIGFDNDTFTSYTHLKISTISQSEKELAEISMNLLEDIINGRKIKKNNSIKTRFIDRETT